MRRIAFAFFALLLAAGCGATSIEVQSSVPADTVWSFSVTLPAAGTFDNAVILLDGSQIARVRGDSGLYFPPNSIDSTKIFSNTEPVDNRIYFLVSPFEKGEHELALKIDDEAIDEESISFFEIYDAGDSDNLQDQMTSIKGSVNTLIQQFNGLESRLGNALDEEDKAELKAGIAGVESSLAGLGAAVEEKGRERDVKINALNGYLQELEAATNDLNRSMGIGLFSVPGINPQMQAFFLVIIIAAAAVFLVVKFRDRISVRNGLYGRAKKPLSFSQHDEDIAEQVMSESHEGQGGKWAFGSESHGKEEGKRFSIGDLIRK